MEWTFSFSFQFTNWNPFSVWPCISVNQYQSRAASPNGRWKAAKTTRTNPANCLLMRVHIHSQHLIQKSSTGTTPPSNMPTKGEPTHRKVNSSTPYFYRLIAHPYPLSYKALELPEQWFMSRLESLSRRDSGRDPVMCKCGLSNLGA